MRIFISWSGALSEQLAMAFRTWLPATLQLVRPYFTPSDVEKGVRWQTEIAEELERSNIGIFCVTRENLNSPWLLFEAGALSKKLDKSKVCPILFGMDSNDVTGPLSQFQLTVFRKEDIYKLLKTINIALEENKLDDVTLESVFQMWWPKLELNVNKIIEDYANGASEPVRSDREMLDDIFQTTRTLLRQNSSAMRSTIAPGAIHELLENYINAFSAVASHEPDEITMRHLAEMRKPILHVALKARYGSENLRSMVERIEMFPFEVEDDIEINF